MKLFEQYAYMAYCVNFAHIKLCVRQAAAFDVQFHFCVDVYLEWQAIMSACCLILGSSLETGYQKMVCS